MARPSRPPGFDMTYRPAESRFGPPFAARLPSLLYLVAAVVLVGMVASAEHGAKDSWLYEYMIQQQHLISARTFAALVMLSALSAILRANMRGVRVRGDSLEYRDVVSALWPKVRRYRWAQIDRIVLDAPRTISLELWDGTHAVLPEVNDRAGLAATLEKVAAARAIPVRGGSGIDEIPDSMDFDEESA